jgi:hypothetical protein
MEEMIFRPTMKPSASPHTKLASAESDRSFATVGLAYLAMAFLTLMLGILAASF